MPHISSATELAQSVCHFVFAKEGLKLSASFDSNARDFFQRTLEYSANLEDVTLNLWMQCIQLGNRVFCVLRSQYNRNCAESAGDREEVSPLKSLLDEVHVFPVVISGLQNLSINIQSDAIQSGNADDLELAVNKSSNDINDEQSPWLALCRDISAELSSSCGPDRMARLQLQKAAKFNADITSAQASGSGKASSSRRASGFSSDKATSSGKSTDSGQAFNSGPGSSSGKESESTQVFGLPSSPQTRAAPPSSTQYRTSWSRPRRPQADMPIPEFEDEFNMRRAFPSGEIGRLDPRDRPTEENPYSIGHEDLDPLGQRPQFPGCIRPGPRGDGGMHPTARHPLFGPRHIGSHGSRLQDPLKYPPGSRYDPVGPGDIPHSGPGPNPNAEDDGDEFDPSLTEQGMFGRDRQRGPRFPPDNEGGPFGGASNMFF